MESAGHAATARRHCPYRCELVWDEGRAGIVELAGGTRVTIDEESGLTPERLLSLAVQGSLMVEFLRLAEESGLEVLGYLSSATAPEHAAPNAEPALSISVCVVSGDASSASAAPAIVERAFRESSIRHALRISLDLDVRSVVLQPTPAA